MDEAALTPAFPILISAYRFEEMSRHARQIGTMCLVLQIPLDMIAPHEAQAGKNHGQTLKRLAERGGLNAAEAVAVLENRPHRSMTFGESHQRLHAMVMEWEAERFIDGIKARATATNALPDKEK